MLSKNPSRNPHHPKGYFWSVDLPFKGNPLKDRSLSTEEYKALDRELKACREGIPEFIEKREAAEKYLADANAKAGYELFIICECSPL